MSSSFISQLNQKMEKNIESRRKEIASLGMKIAKGKKKKKKSFFLYLKICHVRRIDDPPSYDRTFEGNHNESPHVRNI